MGSFSSTRESPLSSSPTRLATMLRIVSGRSLRNEKRKRKESVKNRGGLQGEEPQVTPNRVSNLEEKDTRRVYDPQTFNRGNVLLEDKSRVGAWVEESFAISRGRSGCSA